MENGMFLSKSNVYVGDCGSDLHNRAHEPARCLHYHDFYELFVYLGAKGAFVIGGQTYAVRRGDIVLVGMFTSHMMIPEQEDQAECFVAHVNPELLIAFSTPDSNLLDIFQKDESHSPVYSLGENEFFKYQYLMDEYRAIHLRKGQDILIKAIIHQLMAYAYSDCYSGTHCANTASRDLTVVTRIINYINGHLTEKFSLQKLANEINYSECYICHLFKSATNKAISSYIQEKRIEIATGLLMRSIPIHKVAEQSGFQNYSHFYKTFKRQMGCSPAEYRDKLKAEAGQKSLP